LGATSGFFVLWTSFIAQFMALFNGGVSYTEMFFFIGSSMIGAFGISKGLTVIADKYNRPSIMLYALTGVVGVALIAMPYFGISRSLEDPALMFKFGHICG